MVVVEVREPICYHLLGSLLFFEAPLTPWSIEVPWVPGKALDTCLVAAVVTPVLVS